VEAMTAKAVASFPFCEEDRRFQGAVEVTRGDHTDRSVIGVQLRVGDRSVPLPRNRIRDVLVALVQADAEASSQYQKLLKEMNDGVCEEESG
jgi:hypothetical protein